MPSAVPKLKPWLAAFLSGKENGTTHVTVDKRALGPAAIEALSLPAMPSSGPGAQIVLSLAHPAGAAWNAPVAPVALDDVKGKTWLPSNFRLKIDGLEQACKQLTKLEAVTIKQAPASNATKEPGSIEIPNLVVTVSEHTADDWYAWHQQFVVDGKAGQDKEKSGTLEYLAADGTVLLALALSDLRPVDVLPPKPKKLKGQPVKVVLSPKKIGIR